MIKLYEDNEDLVYGIPSLGEVVIHKDFRSKELTTTPTVIFKETKDTITYTLPDGNLCTVLKSMGLAPKEVVVRYYMLKFFNKFFPCQNK